MNDAQIYEQQMVPLVTGFVRGALKFGGTQDAIRDAVQEAFPRLRPTQVISLVQSGAMAYSRQLN